jgi:hypothetical protein
MRLAGPSLLRIAPHIDKQVDREPRIGQGG